MKIQMIVKTPMGQFEGQIAEATEEDLQKACNLFEMAAKGQLTHMSFRSSMGDMVYLSEKVIENSVFILKQFD